MVIVFYSDKPINNIDDDVLNRVVFSKQLAKAILSYTKIDNLAIGLCGKWGSGKTSIINMVLQEIEERVKCIAAEEKPIVVQFNPWNYSDCTQLLSQFFETVKAEIGQVEDAQKIALVGEALQRYSSILEYTYYIPIVGQYLSPLKDIVNGVGEQLEENASVQNSLEYQKKNVVKLLEKQKQKIIVIIDDIDRLNNQQIRLVFQLVNSLAGFPNMIYLLSFDRDIVARALGEEQRCNGEEYLEKVIQVLFELPVIDRAAINSSFKKMFYNIVKDENVNIDYWEKVFECISPFLSSMRNVKRIINTFEFKYGLIKEEVNCLDLLVLTTLQIYVPKLYSWIYNNKIILINNGRDNRLPSSKEGKDKSDMYLGQLKEIYSENPTHALHILQCLFPKVASETGNADCIVDKVTELEYQQRIASGKFFGRYFTLSLGYNEVGRKQVLESLKIYSEQELKKYFVELKKREQLSSYLNELKVCVGEIPKARCEVVFQLLVEILGWGNNYEKTIDSEIMYSFQGCLYQILEENDNKKISNYSLLVSAIESLKIEQLPVVCRIVDRVENNYGRLDSVHKSNYLYMNEEELNLIEIQLMKKIEEVTQQDCLFDYKNISYVKKIWNHLNSDSWKTYEQRMENDVANIPKCIANYLHEFGVKNWSFDKTSLSKYIDIDDAYQKILTLKTTEGFASLNSHFKRVAVAFYCWHNDGGEINYNISEAKIDLMISEWEMELAGKR